MCFIFSEAKEEAAFATGVSAAPTPPKAIDRKKLRLFMGI